MKALAAYAGLVETPRINEEISFSGLEIGFPQGIWIDADGGADPVRLAITMTSYPC